MNVQPIISLCIRRCVRSKDGRGTWQAERSCCAALIRLGSSPLLAYDVAAAARRTGEFIARGCK